jgi:hypothetical protein
MSEEDKKLYNFDIRRLDWDKYLFDYLMGVKVKKLLVRPRLHMNPVAVVFAER